MISSAKTGQLLQNLVMLTRSGLDLATCIRTLEADCADPRLAKKLAGIQKQLENGDPFSQSLSSAQLFSPYAISLITLGERSGRLAENLSVIAEQEKKERFFKSQLQSALLYPAIVLAIALIVGIGVSLFILPKLADLFSQLSIQLPALTRALVALGLFIKHAPPLFLPLATGGVILLLISFVSSEKGRALLHGALAGLPGTGSLIRESELARMGSVAGSLLHAGVPITDTLASLADTAPLAQWRRFYRSLADSIERGQSFKQCFSAAAAARLLPRAVQTMLTTAEQSGRLAQTFADIGRLFEEKVAEDSKRLAIALEPALLVVVWIGVVFLALAVLLPIYQIIGTLNR